MRAIGRQRRLWSAVAFALTLSVPAAAQLSPDQIEETGPRDPAVTDSLRWERISDDMVYLDPNAPFEPDMDARIAIPEPPKTRDEEVEEARWTTGLIFGLILAIVIALFIWQGARISVGFNRTDDKRRREGTDDGPSSSWDDLPEDGFLERLARMADRRAALILLTSRALERAAEANGINLSRAQTAREVVRTIPRDWRHRDGLNRLVRETEVVHFGGRDLPEARWQDCLALARPIFGRDAKGSAQGTVRGAA